MTRWLLWYVVLLPVTLMVHEAGHALCALVARVPVAAVSIGIGPLLWRGRIGRTLVDVRAAPLAGFVATPFLGPPRPRHILVGLGGVLADAAVIAGVIWLDLGGHVPNLPWFVRDALGPLVFVQLLSIITNLSPFQTKAGDVSDGLQLVRMLRSLGEPNPYDRTYASLLVQYGITDVTPSAAAPYIIYWSMHPERWSDPDLWRLGRDVFLDLLAREKVSHDDELLILDELVTSGLIHGDAALCPELDAWSARAWKLAPWTKTLLGSRGSVLVMCGHYAEGKDLLERCAVNNETPIDIIMSNAFLARAEHGLGNDAEARRLIAAARAAAESSRPQFLGLIERVEAEIGGGGTYGRAEIT